MSGRCLCAIRLSNVHIGNELLLLVNAQVKELLDQVAVDDAKALLVARVIREATPQLVIHAPDAFDRLAQFGLELVQEGPDVLG